MISTKRITKAILSMLDGDERMADAAIEYCSEIRVDSLTWFVEELEFVHNCHKTIGMVIDDILSKVVNQGKSLCIDLEKQQYYIKDPFTNFLDTKEEELDAESPIGFAAYYYRWDYWVDKYLMPEVLRVVQHYNACITEYDRNNGRIFIDIQ